MSLTNLLVPTYLNMLRALSGWLDKAEDHAPGAEGEALLSARLAPDMFPLSTQVRFACVQAREATFRLTDGPVPDAVTQLGLEGRTAGERPGSIADARARIAETLSALEALGPDALDEGAGRLVTLSLPDGLVFDMTGAQYARDWALPQFYFHVTSAYAILRHHGVALGKPDYVPHVLAYLRPGTMPRGDESGSRSGRPT